MISTTTVTGGGSTNAAVPVTGDNDIRVVGQAGSVLPIDNPGPDTRSIREIAEVIKPTAILPAAHPTAVEKTKPIQIWEGVVLYVDESKASMGVRLSTFGRFPEHNASIKLEWVPDQDRDLVQPGAVFYLTLFRRLNGGSVQNSQEIRFRRLPSWSNFQIRKVAEAADILATKKGLDGPRSD